MLKRWETGTLTTEPAFQPRDVTTNVKLTDLLYMTEEEFRMAVGEDTTDFLSVRLF